MSVQDAKQRLEEVRARRRELQAEREKALAALNRRRQGATSAVMPEPASLADVGREMAANREKVEAAEEALAGVRQEEEEAAAAVKLAEERAAVARAKELQTDAGSIVAAAAGLVDELEEKARRLGEIGAEHHRLLSPYRQELPALEKNGERAIFKARDTIRTFVQTFRKETP